MAPVLVLVTNPSTKVVSPLFITDLAQPILFSSGLTAKKNAPETPQNAEIPLATPEKLPLLSHILPSLQKAIILYITAIKFLATPYFSRLNRIDRYMKKLPKNTTSLGNSLPPCIIVSIISPSTTQLTAKACIN